MDHIVIGFNSTASWRSGPNTRGSYNIFSSCWTTLLICVWSSIHFDIPTRRREWFSKLAFKLIPYIIIAVLVPEYIFVSAFIQHINARYVVKQANTFLENLPTEHIPWYKRSIPSCLKRKHTSSAGESKIGPDFEKVCDILFTGIL